MPGLSFYFSLAGSVGGVPGVGVSPGIRKPNASCRLFNFSCFCRAIRSTPVIVFVQ